MKSSMSLAETARRLGVSRRSVWEALVGFSPLVNATVGDHGKLEFAAATVERLAMIFSARRKGWTDPEIGDLLARSDPVAETPTPAPRLWDPSDEGGRPLAGPATPGPASIERFLEIALRPILRELDALRAELQALKEA
ncbi:MAG: hypothetical protein GX442_10100 [Candidatus Riflebacteria bacterium]|nr:hypothetical protein [Candidatus Riflebacteria bacterium]